MKPMLVVACYDGTVHTQFMQSVLNSQLLLAAQGIPLTVQNLDGCCHVDDAYNLLLRFFLNSDCTHVITVGSDQGWRAEDMLKLLNHGKKHDIVAGVVPKKSEDPEWNVVYAAEQLWADSDGLIEAHMVGTGFMCLSRNAVEKLAEGAENYILYGMRDVPLILERRILGFGRFSGDNVLCMKWRELGGKLYVDPEMHFTHSGTKTWAGCVGDWYRARMKDDLAEDAHEVLMAAK